MSNALEEFSNQLLQEAQVAAEADALTLDEALGSVFARHIEDLEIAVDLQEFHATCRGPNNRRLSVMAVGEDDADGSMSIVVGKFYDEPTTTLGTSDITQALDGARAYVEASLNCWLQERLEESSQEYELAEYLRDRFEHVSKFRIVLVSNGSTTSRLKKLDSDEVRGKPVSYQIWDIHRLHKALSSPTGHEPIQVDLRSIQGRGIPCVSGGSEVDGASTYLFTLSGKQLAEVYEEHGSRVLESNVRGFLSIRGKVNKGIQFTLESHPEMFLAYNNGLTTTATAAEVEATDGGLRLNSLTDWQIVNGGQTTASMWYFLAKNKASKSTKLSNLETAHVQVKLVVVDPDRAADIVPDIARYANSQNKVSGSDFFSNSPYHKRLEQLSRQTLAPAAEGLQHETHWFYERTRGAYDNEKTKLTPARASKFELSFPRAQKFDKIDVARAENIWSLRPDVVSKGAQTSFSVFSEKTLEIWDQHADDVNGVYFRDLVAKLIIVHGARKRVMASEWWGRGYLANIVAYGLAKFLHDLEELFPGHELDLPSVWREQECNELFLENIAVACEAALGHLTSNDRPTLNVTQWAKQASCWEEFMDEPLEYYETFEDIVVKRAERAHEKLTASEEQKTETQLRGYIDIVQMDKSVWISLLGFSDEHGLLTEKERSIASALLQKGYVTEGQSQVLAHALQRAEEHGLAL